MTRARCQHGRGKDDPDAYDRMQWQREDTLDPVARLLPLPIRPVRRSPLKHRDAILRRRRAYQAAWKRAYRQRPSVKMRAPSEHRRAQQRDYARRKRACGEDSQ